MSGPKTSRYTLTPEQLRVLREQLERQRRTIEEYSKLKHAVKELKSLCAGFDSSVEKAKALYSRTSEGNEFIQLVTDLKVQAWRIIEQNSGISQESGLEVLVGGCKALESFCKQVRKTEKDLKKQAVEFEEKLTTSINDNLERGFRVSFDNIKRGSENRSAEKLRKQVIRRLDAFKVEISLPPEYLVEIEEAKRKITEIENANFIENFNALTVAPLEKKCQQYLNNLNKYGERFNELLSRYEALCEMLAIQKKEINFTVEAMNKLEAEITLMEKKLVEAEEQAYISRSIDEVMAEMGYDVLGYREVIKRTGTQFRNKLYSFSDGTAVNVTYASDGKITMELGGVDIVDRLPTEDETRHLCEDMKSFCKDFDEIEKRLLNKGVVVGNRISILPVQEEYAQIINTDDYNLRGKIETFKTKHVSGSKAEKKVMRNE